VLKVQGPAGPRLRRRQLFLSDPALRGVPRTWKGFLKQKKEHGGIILGAVAALAKADEVSQ